MVLGMVVDGRVVVGVVGGRVVVVGMVVGGTVVGGGLISFSDVTLFIGFSALLNECV